MNSVNLKWAAGVAGLLVLGALAGDLILGGATAATVNDIYDTDNAQVEARLETLPDAGCVISGCVFVPGSVATARTCMPKTEVTKAAPQSACLKLMDYVARVGLAKLQFPGIDAGQ